MIGRTKIALSALLAIGAVASARAAHAYCRSTTGCKDALGQSVSRATGDDCFEAVDTCPSHPLAWQEPCVGFSVDTHGSMFRNLTAPETIAMVQAAFDAWLAPVCNGERPGLSVEYLGPSDCRTFEYNPANTWYGNVNTIFFVDGIPAPVCGGNAGSGDTIGDTCNSFDAATGAMFDSDIALDVNESTLTAPDTDLRSVLLHEVGHFLGLAHVMDSKDVMFWQYTGQLVLSDDDKRGICAVYPPGRATDGVCTYLPRHGYSPECKAEQQPITCSAARAPHAPGPGVVALAMLGAGAVLGRSRWGTPPYPRRRRRASGPVADARARAPV